MIVCPRCSKDNQAHYKFCLGCGAELPREAQPAPKNFTAPTPPSGFESSSAGTGPATAATPARVGFGGAPVVASPAAASPAGASPAAGPAGAASAMVKCPSCHAGVPQSFQFCGTCGFAMAGAGGATAPSSAGAAPAASASTGEARGSLVLIRPDGTEGQSFPLSDQQTHIGRDAGGVFGADSYLSPTHATFYFKGDALFVRDEKSLNGVYVRLDAEVPVELRHGSVFRIGQEIIRFERVDAPTASEQGVEVMGSPNPGYLGRVCLIIGRAGIGNTYCVPAEGFHMGRERGDIIFPDDGYVSGLHCRIHKEGNKILLTDVGSSNGTFIRVEGEAQVQPGSLVLMGQQLFRVSF